MTNLAGNYSPFEANVMHAYDGASDTMEGYEAACAAFLRGHPSGRLLAAEAAGYEALVLTERLVPMLDVAGDIHGDHEAAGDVLDFILERSYRRYFPGN